MRKIAHLSDLHFGTERKEIVEGLVKDLQTVQPDVIVISGDLTQRARTRQFKNAQVFLQRLEPPVVIVPGNHDIPLFDLFRRFLMPLTRYQKYITEDLSPVYLDDEILVYGVNSARSLTWKEGRISVEQMQEMHKALCEVPDSVFKIVVTHHPFIPPPEDEGIRLVGRSKKVLQIVAECGIDLLLAGHLHHGYSGDIRPYYPETKNSIIVAQAGTAVSRRTRKKPNVYNLLTVDPLHMTITIREWNGHRFFKRGTTFYHKEREEWRIGQE
jgi:3',5'-cyclic AMP phosphodiesterase CpdA